MTTNAQENQLNVLQDRFGLKAASYLCLGTEQLPYDVSERLRAARVQAVVKRQIAKIQHAVAVHTNGSSTLTWGAGSGDDFNLWNAIASAIPLLALVLGLILINCIQNDSHAKELAEVDAALLVDELPPAAFADSGFVQFLKSER